MSRDGKILPDNLTNNNKKFNNPDVNGTSLIKKKLKRRFAGHLPIDLMKFVENDSYSLLVKGNPGTGKTTFALTLMDNLQHDSNYFFISTRLSLRQLDHYFPWISRFKSNNNLGYEYKFEDARLDEPESLFERITNQLMDVKSPVIIIDSWDIIASFMDRDSRLNNERVLQIWRERAGAKLIFLSETYETGILDSIVDGVITLKNKLAPNFYRYLVINKLRGISINCMKYYFSLYNSFFYIFDPIYDLNVFEELNTNIYFKQKIKNQINRYGKNLYKNKNNLYLSRFIFKKNFIFIKVDPKINDKLLFSLLLEPFYFWILSKKLIMMSNDDWKFYHVFNELVSFIRTSTGKNNLGDEISRISHYKLDGFSNIDDQCKQFETFFKKILDSNNGANQSNSSIINIFNGDKEPKLLTDIKFLKLLERDSILNLIIFKSANIEIEESLIQNSVYFNIVLKGKNVILEIIDSSGLRFGAFVENDSLFVQWVKID